jgi:hypothetical protein
MKRLRGRRTGLAMGVLLTVAACGTQAPSPRDSAPPSASPSGLASAAPASSPSASPSAAVVTAGTVTLADEGCSFHGALPPGAGSFAITAVNTTSDDAGFDLWRLRPQTTFADWVAYHERQQAAIDAGTEGDGPPFSIAEDVHLQLAVGPGGRAELLEPAAAVAVYALQCWRFAADGDRLMTAGPVGPRPAARGYHALVDVRGEGALLVSGGATGPGPAGLAETWLLDLASGWTPISGDDDPEFGEAVALHEPSGLVVSFLGSDLSVFDPSTGAWEVRPHEDGPKGLIGIRMAYDAGSDRMILFGGWGATFSDATWAYDVAADTWEEMAPPTAPPARNFTTLAYDAQSDRVILFGGGTETETFGDTWAYDHDSDTWEEMAPTTAPPASSYGAAVYDPGTDRVILFGGAYGAFLSEDAVGETWAFDYESGSWRDLAPSEAPSARGWHAMARDAESGRIVLVGGGPLRQAFTDEVWIYDAANNRWVPHEP